ncbi:Sirohydrochlorin ferrochelatase [Seinonella peptonophila]|uniref:Sirohydrochlorin ferrochelatase n=2 Tax=Seinonella peptonophila TaxID=112248 RepID=A0A1M4Z2R5_9BACL|nr:Sirohydrochlorin ferrochelatase [Seinonella peptonophila]
MRRGVLVIAHGSRDPDWIRLVDDAVNQAKIECPVVVSFLEIVTGRLIPDGLRELEEMGVNEIFALPLFVSSGSTHIAEIAHLLGESPHLPIEVDEEPYPHHAKIHYLEPMDDHPLIAEILIERAERLSQHPSEEVLMLIGHGSEYAGYRERWHSVVQGLGHRICEKLPFSEVISGFMHPDTLASKAKEYAGRRIIGLPLFLSEGYFTRHVIPQKLSDSSVIYDGKTYLPHRNVSLWLEAVANVSS